MPAHRVAGEIGVLRIGVQFPLRDVEHLHRIEPAPILPIEAVRPAIGGNHNVRPGFWRIRRGLIGGFDRGAVQGKNQGQGISVVLFWMSRLHHVILHASIDVAEERAFVHLCWSRESDGEMLLGEDFARRGFPPQPQIQICRTGAVGRDSAIPEHGLAHAERRN